MHSTKWATRACIYLFWATSKGWLLWVYISRLRTAFTARIKHIWAPFSPRINPETPKFPGPQSAMATGAIHIESLWGTIEIITSNLLSGRSHVARDFLCIHTHKNVKSKSWVAAKRARWLPCWILLCVLHWNINTNVYGTWKHQYFPAFGNLLSAKRIVISNFQEDDLTYKEIKTDRRAFKCSVDATNMKGKKPPLGIQPRSAATEPPFWVSDANETFFPGVQAKPLVFTAKAVRSTHY